LLSTFFGRASQEISCKKIFKKVREVYISPYCRLVLVPPIFMKFGVQGQLTDIITCVKFLVDRFRGYWVLTPPKLPFPIDLVRRPYNSVALPCDTVINAVFTAYWLAVRVCPFSSRVIMRADRDIVLPILSVCLMPVLCLNDCTYLQTFSTTW